MKPDMSEEVVGGESEEGENVDVDVILEKYGDDVNSKKRIGR